MTLPNGITAAYEYDTASQLKKLTYKRGATTIGEASFEYDVNGRRTNITGSLAQYLSPTAFENAQYDVSNKQTAVNNQTLNYDSNGNLTSDGVNTYTWNARDELISIAGPSLTASFQYDGEGRRISKTVNGVTTTFVYDGLQVVEERQAAGPVITQLAGGLDEVFFRKANNNTEYLLTDALGSTWGLADSAGQVNTQYKYDVFGGTQASGQVSATNNSLQYTGRENDATGLYYYRNRYYSPNLRRFISRDPLREGAGENEYSYVSNNPISLTDPLGLQEGPVNYLRDPFPAEYWVANAASNTVSDLLFLDTIAAAAWTLGNWCRPLSERLWAGAKIVVIGVFAALGGVILGKLLGLAGRAIAPLFKRIPMGSMSKAASKANCFVAGTLIHTKEGLKPIEEIKAGDEVLSYNEQTRQTQYQSVVRTFVNQAKEFLEVKVTGEDELLMTTLGHPFYVQRARSNTSDESDESDGSDEGKWLLSKSVKPGDRLLRPNGDWVRIVSINYVVKSQPIYNFEVADNHNYFVGEQGLLVHNDSLVQRLRNGEDVIVNSLDDARELLKQFPELKPGNRSTCINSCLPGPDARGTYRGDLMYAYKTENGVLTKAENFIHPSPPTPPLHANNPHYNLYFQNGKKAAIIIKQY